MSRGATIERVRLRFRLLIVVLAIGSSCVAASVAALKVGDCFDVSLADQTVTHVQPRPCTELHSAEVFFVGNVPASKSATYPGDDVIKSYVETECVPAFRTYTGRAFDKDKKYNIEYLLPTGAIRPRLDFAVDCYVVRIDGQPFKGSVRAAG